MMMTMEAKRHRVSALLDTKVSTREICRLVPCSKFLVLKVRKLKESGKSLERKPGSGEHNKNLTDNVLEDIKAKVETVPTVSQRIRAKELNLARGTISSAMKILGFTSVRF